jgi:pyridoxine kinase
MSDSSILPVLMLSDLPAYGRVALALGIPLLERRGIQTSNVPTALLSTHGAYRGAVCVPQTEFLRRALDHLRELSLRFSAVYTGFVAESTQFALIASLAREQREKGTFILVDPILGDNGRVYGIMPADAVVHMRELVRDADLITPNITEAALLLGKAADERPKTAAELQEWLLELSKLGPRFVVATSAPVANSGEHIGIVAYDGLENCFVTIEHRLVPPNFPGSGDYFTSALLADLIHSTKTAKHGGVLRNDLISSRVFERACRRAAGMVARALSRSRALKNDPRQGLVEL